MGGLSKGVEVLSVCQTLVDSEDIAKTRSSLSVLNLDILFLQPAQHAGTIIIYTEEETEMCVGLRMKEEGPDRENTALNTWF